MTSNGPTLEEMYDPTRLVCAFCFRTATVGYRWTPAGGFSLRCALHEPIGSGLGADVLTGDELAAEYAAHLLRRGTA